MSYQKTATESNSAITTGSSIQFHA